MCRAGLCEKPTGASLTTAIVWAIFCLDVVMHFTEATTKGVLLSVIEAWLLLPAWKRLLSVPNLNKPVP